MKLKILIEQLVKNTLLPYDERKEKFPIFKNPTPDELEKAKEDYESVRYIVRLFKDKHSQESLDSINVGDVFVFNPQVPHYLAAQKLEIPHKYRVHIPVWGDFGFGVSKINNNKLKLSRELLKQIPKKDKKKFELFFTNY